MKRCPTCQKTFDDAMRFCQADGTPLVEDTTPADPYKTMVASKEDIAAALGASVTPPPGPSESPAAEDEPLQIPSQPLSAPVPSSELKTRLADEDRGEGQVMEIPPLVEETPADVPKFSEPEVAPPSFGSTPPSPFSSPSDSGVGDFPTTPPIPSPFTAAAFEPSPSTPQTSEPEPARAAFSEPEPTTPTYSEPETPNFAEPEPAPTPAFNPFEAQASAPSESAMAQNEWTPPSPVSSSQNQPGGINMSSPPPAAAGQNQTLAIISLICGIAGMTICCGTFVVPLVGLVLGFMARNKANSDPMHYGGSGLALGGIITGALGLVGSIIVGIYLLLNFAYIMSQIR
jgi:hypothetical protein